MKTHLKTLLLGTCLLLTQKLQAQYLGVTCGFDYSNDLAGPNNGMHNTPLFNSSSSNPNATWDNWAEELAASGVDFVAPNLRGSFPNTSCNPANIAPLITALNNRGLANRIKIAVFDDNASSWTAQWNQANGRGFGYAVPFDISNSANWVYLWDYNYKKFFETVPDANRFKINNRPVIITWTGNTYFIANMQGNVSRALNYVRQQCQSTFGFNPYIIVSGDTLQNDTTCNNSAVVDGTQNWFTAGGPSYTLATTFGNKVGALCPQFQFSGQSGFIDPNHGQTLATGLINTRGAGATLTLVEGFTDWEEDAALFRVRNLDPNSNPLGYATTYYDYPNQRLNLLRRHGNFPFPCEMKFEVEGCDTYGGAAGGNGKVNFYRNGNIGIETTGDTGGGYNVGWIQPNQWFEWKEVPIQGTNVHLQVRVASPNNNSKLHFVIDNVTYPSITVPNTGNWQGYATVETGAAYTFAKGSTHTVRIVCETGGFNFNYWQYRNIIPITKNISLQSTANNKWITVTNATSPLIASKTTTGTSEQFQLVDRSSTYWYGCVALKSLNNNQYVSADPFGINPLLANRAAAGLYETFQWTDNGDGTIHLRAIVNNMAVTAENGGAQPIINNRVTQGPWETFKLKVW